MKAPKNKDHNQGRRKMSNIMSNVEFAINVNDHNIDIIDMPEQERIDGLMSLPITGTAWQAQGLWHNADSQSPVPVIVLWHIVADDDAEGSAVDWDNPWLIIPTEDDYLANPANGEVDTREGWKEQFAQNPDWGNFEDAELVRVEPNIPDQFGYDDGFGDWRNA